MKNERNSFSSLLSFIYNFVLQPNSSGAAVVSPLIKIIEHLYPIFA